MRMWPPDKPHLPTVGQEVIEGGLSEHIQRSDARVWFDRPEERFTFVLEMVNGFVVCSRHAL
jgi:hypothetical protein